MNRMTQNILAAITLTQDISYSGSDGALVVPAGKTVTLDLNGFTIDRGLTSAVNEGSVIQVRGELIINDSKGTGKITGGSKTGLYRHGENMTINKLKK